MFERTLHTPRLSFQPPPRPPSTPLDPPSTPPSTSELWHTCHQSCLLLSVHITNLRVPITNLSVSITNLRVSITPRVPIIDRPPASRRKRKHHIRVLSLSNTKRDSNTVEEASSEPEED
jgi:hypothetical protein